MYDTRKLINDKKGGENDLTKARQNIRAPTKLVGDVSN